MTNSLHPKPLCTMFLLLLSLSAACTLEEQLVFMPVRTDSYDLPGNRIPMDRIETLELTSNDGVRIFAILARQEASSGHPTVYYLHGQATNLDDSWHYIMRLWDLGWNVLAIDYRGFGRSEGSPTEAGLYLDADAGAEALDELPGVDPDRVVIWGYSLGTGVASHVGLEHPQGALVLEAPYTSMSEVVEGTTPVSVPSAWIADVELDTLSRMADIHIPVVVVHGTEDVRIPYRMGQEVFDRANEPKRFVSVAGAGHTELLERADSRIVEALAEIAPNLTP